MFPLLLPMDWTEFVTSDTVTWLLRPNNPSFRFWTRQHLVDRPITDQEIKESQNAVMVSPCIKTILGEQKGEGHWLLKNTYKGKMFCEIDEMNKPSKWITMRALRVLRRYFS